MKLLIKRLVAFYTLTCFLANILLAQQVIRQAGVSAPAGVSISPVNSGSASDPAIKQSMNGTTVVDIATPSARGVSSNNWNEFNVGQDGIIFNNSAAPVLTQLGGWTDGNRRLAGGEASIILNQVVGANRSSLLGQVEIAGKAAEFILANPNGITCNGCGFINTPSVSLITGQSRFSANGDLLFDINGGDVLIDGKGLNAANIDRFDIVSRYAQINANLFANNLSIINGSNQYNYSSKSATANAAGSSGGVLFALNTTALGAMYGNSIRLIGTEKGLGVNLQGIVQSTNDLQITAEGDLQLRHVLANNQLSVHSVSGNVTTQEIAFGKNAVIQAAGDLV
ncbi:MAG TPA: filamentous hemagglutinin N-terminal domain-containing protein, partial [Steroidobacteraceae bacterium]|nr:filamentous hemagglutinin N-terminal domain-containing protein [Steroidobacteraceae bacterium]